MCRAFGAPIVTFDLTHGSKLSVKSDMGFEANGEPTKARTSCLKKGFYGKHGEKF